MRPGGAWILMALAMAAWPCAGAAPAARLEQAEVTAIPGGRPLYREVHYLPEDRPSERWVLYRCPDNTPFARKHVVASTLPAAPNFRLEDGRDGYREGVRGAPGARVVYVRQDGREESARKLAVPANAVIDSGFDAAVRVHWDALVRGEMVELRFLVPSRQQFYPVRIRRIAGLEWNGQRAMRLRLQLDTWFGFATPDVTLVYGLDDRRLLEFGGTGNVRDARGRNPQVRIVFAARAAKASLGELAEIQKLPLNGRCRF